MKHDFLRRLSAFALVLTLVLGLFPSAFAAEGDGEPAPEPSVSLDSETLTLLLGGGTGTLHAATENIPDGTLEGCTWTSSNNEVATVQPDESDSLQAVVTPRKAGVAVITVTASWTPEGGEKQMVTDICTVTVEEPAEISGVTLNRSEMVLVIGRTGQLTAAVEPSNVLDKTVTWSSSDDSIVSVDQDGNLTALAVGKAVITAAAGGFSAECAVTVSVPITDIFFARPAIQFDNLGGRTQQVSVSVAPSNAVFDDITWETQDPQVATVERDGVTGVLAVVTAVGPGETTLTASIENRVAECKVIVSGITLNRTSLTMLEGRTDILSVTGTYGNAEGPVEWLSSDMSVVSVANGKLTARSIGTAVITASKGSYTASCEVTVEEDTSGLIEAGRVTAGERLNFSDFMAQINEKCLENTGAALSYITNLSVEPEQGLVHDEYLSEGDTGAGVGMIERFYYQPGTGQVGISRLAFVSRQDFSGIAEVYFTAWSTDRKSFTGVIRVLVSSVADVSYTTSARTPVTFRAMDFNDTCRGETGRDLSYITFTVPQVSRGTLYYNYQGPSQYTEKVTGDTRYRRTGIPNIDAVTFVPNDDYSGTFSIIYRAVDTGGASFTGRITMMVNNPMDAELADIYLTTQKGSPLIFETGDFDAACRRITGESLVHVTFTPPASSQGTLYYNYRASGASDGVVNAKSRYYRNGVPSLGNVCFISAKNAPDQVAIPYTGCGSNGSTFEGIIYIALEEEYSRNIEYTVSSGKAVTLDTADFDAACTAVKGTYLNYVRFTPHAVGSPEGVLCYLYNSEKGTYSSRVYAGTNYYRSSGANNANNRLLRDVTFRSSQGYTGTVRIPYTAYTRDGDSFTGVLVIHVSDPAPDDLKLAGTGSSPVKLTASNLQSVCNPVLLKQLSYIQITKLPSENAGRLYSNYSGFGTGTQVMTGTRYYCSGSPSVNQLSFVPKGGFQGDAVVEYTGVSTAGQEVRGQIIITIGTASTSRYFVDMDRHGWAISAVDYLYQNGVTVGMTENTYGPKRNIRRCDFVVMLCRAFDFKSNGAASGFVDVPVNSYYADAVAAAKRLGIVNGSGGGKFSPTNALTRQDAMVIIFNTLKGLGWTLDDVSTESLNAHPDGGRVSEYARPAVSALVQLGVIKGDSSGMLRPRDPITRAEMAVILHYVMTM